MMKGNQVNGWTQEDVLRFQELCVKANIIQLKRALQELDAYYWDRIERLAEFTPL